MARTTRRIYSKRRKRSPAKFEAIRDPNFIATNSSIAADDAPPSIQANYQGKKNDQFSMIYANPQNTGAQNPYSKSIAPKSGAHSHKANTGQGAAGNVFQQDDIKRGQMELDQAKKDHMQEAGATAQRNRQQELLSDLQSKKPSPYLGDNPRETSKSFGKRMQEMLGKGTIYTAM